MSARTARVQRFWGGALALLALLLLALFLGSRCRCEDGGMQPMSSQNFVESPLGQQLLSPPPQSSLALESNLDSKSSAPTPHTDADFAASGARSFLAYMLTDAYRPPPETPFVPFAQEESRFDVVRARYHLADTQVDIAQTLSIVSITISKEAPPTGDCVSVAEQLARTALAPRQPLRLVVSSSSRGWTFGRADSHPPTSDLPSSSFPAPHWDEELLWWCAPGKVGFISLKGLGDPTRAVLSFEEDFNAHWFTRRP